MMKTEIFSPGYNFAYRLFPFALPVAVHEKAEWPLPPHSSLCPSAYLAGLHQAVWNIEFNSVVYYVYILPYTCCINAAHSKLILASE